MRLSQDQKHRWRVVKLDAVVSAANACCAGVDYQGCPKSHIYESYDKTAINNAKGKRKGSASGSFHPWDCARFVRLMDHLARLELRLNTERLMFIREAIKASKDE